MAELDTAQAAAAAKLLELIAIQRISQSIYVAAALGIADLIADEPKSAEQLAKATGVKADVSSARHADAGRCRCIGAGGCGPVRADPNR